MNQSTKSMLLWGGVAVVVIGMVVLLAIFGSKESTTSTTLKEETTTADHVEGSSTPKVTLVEYSDFQCPACGAMFPLIKQLVNDYPDDLQVIYRHYPLRSIHPNAQMAAQASEAASLQGKFWEMHDGLFNTQSQWSSEEDPVAFFVTLANSLGLDVAQFEQDISSGEVEKIVNESYDRATGMRLSGTPSIFINGTLIQNPGSYAAFRDIIDAAINS